jgi:hypothetical protein
MLEHHELDSGAETQLLDLLGYVDQSCDRFQITDNPVTGHQESKLTKVGQLLASIENALAVYLSGEKHLDHVPRPAHYVAALKPISRDAERLVKTLIGENQYILDEISRSGADISAIEAALYSLVQACDTVIKKNQRLPSKGAPKNVALTETIKRLRHIFRSRYQGKRTGRNRKGSFQVLGEEEKREVSFVKTALISARIVPRSMTSEKMLGYFRDPRCAVPQERGALAERIANQAERPATRSRHDKTSPYTWPSKNIAPGRPKSPRPKKRNK